MPLRILATLQNQNNLCFHEKDKVKIRLYSLCFLNAAQRQELYHLDREYERCSRHVIGQRIMRFRYEVTLTERLFVIITTPTAHENKICRFTPKVKRSPFQDG